MARRQGLFEDVLDLTARLPWWVGVALAVFSYLVLHHFAAMEIPKPGSTKDLGSMMTRQIFVTLATVGQYFLPLLFLLGAAMSAIGRWKRGALHARASSAAGKNVLDGMSWREFEQLVGEHFRRQGFGVEETGGCGADGGVDLVLTRGSDRYFAQCKQWKARQVGVQIIRELYGVMAAQGAAGGYVVTSGVFTEEARRFAEGREIKLIGGDQLLTMIRDTQSAPAASRGNREASAAPACPQCGSTMVLRTARKGSNAGNSFWGCSTFPRCKGTRPV